MQAKFFDIKPEEPQGISVEQYCSFYLSSPEARDLSLSAILIELPYDGKSRRAFLSAAIDLLNSTYPNITSLDLRHSGLELNDLEPLLRLDHVRFIDLVWNNFNVASPDVAPMLNALKDKFELALDEPIRMPAPC